MSDTRQIQDNVPEKDESRETSVFLLITRVFITDSIVAFWKKVREILSVIKYYLVFGIFPSRKNQPYSIELLRSKRLLETFFVLLVLKIVVKELDGFNFDTLSSNMGNLFVMLVYYLGIMLFAFLGKGIGFISDRAHIKDIQSYMLREYNFLFLIYFFLLFTVLNINENNVNGLFLFIFIAVFHVVYSFLRVFKTQETFKYFFFSLVIIVIVFLVFLFFSTITIGVLTNINTQ